MNDRRVRRGWPMAVFAGMGVLLAGCAAPAPAGSAVASTAARAATTAAERAVTTATVAPGTVAPGTVVPPVEECPKGALPTLTAGTLTIGTASPAAAPWFVGGSPSSGQGLESAVAYAVADALGYGRDQVAWVDVDPAAAIAGSARGFDLDLNQFTVPDSGTATADYSTGYFSVTDTLVTTRAGTAPSPSSMAAVKGMNVGAVAGTSGVAAAQDVSGAAPKSFGSQRAALAGLTSGSVAGIVLPTPAALAAAAADPALLLVGQLPTEPRVQPDQLKVLLVKGSELTGCVSAAVDRLRVEGTLEQLAEQWIEPQVPHLS